MELKLDKYEYEGEGVHSVAIPPGFTVRLSCFCHLNDSSDIAVSFHLQYANATHSVSCPVETGSGTECSEIPERKWSVCRNQSEPHNCILVLHDFGVSDDGTYWCSTTVGGREVQSNELDLEALRSLEPAKSSNKASDISTVLPIVAVALLIIIIFGVFTFKCVKSRRQRRE